MAKMYYAVNRIQHGETSGVVTVFEVGDRVTGLDKETMVALWQAGSLTEVDPDEQMQKQADLEARVAQLEAELAEARAAAAVPPAEAATSPAEEEPAADAGEPVTPTE
jgi:hypothetical protein